jgi:hypothetical protein
MGPAVAIVQYNMTLQQYIESAHEVYGHLNHFQHSYTIGGASLTNLQVNFQVPSVM